MLSADRTPLSVDVANELRDALRRRQKELPARWLAAVDAASLRAGAGAAGRHEHEETELALGLGMLRGALADVRPRGIICVQPSASAASIALADELCARGGVVSVAAAELDSGLAGEMLERITSRCSSESASALECDCTTELPLPDRFPRPRLYLCMGNVLGSTSAVGAVRLLRVLRTTMTPSDAILLGLDPLSDAQARIGPESLDHDEASRHLAALRLINSTAGAGFDLSRFDFQPTFDAENNRIETHLVARRSLDVEVPGVCDVRFRKGESIRTSVRCRFDRNRVAAMMAGVGLSLRVWTTDADARFVVALAAPAV